MAFGKVLKGVVSTYEVTAGSPNGSFAHIDAVDSLIVTRAAAGKAFVNTLVVIFVRNCNFGWLVASR